MTSGPARSTMEIRPAVLQDARRIAEIHVRAWEAAYRGLMPDSVLDAMSVGEREIAWRDRLRKGEVTVLVSCESAAVTGWLVLGRSRDDKATDSEREIYGLYVDPTGWRRGAGTHLWNEGYRVLKNASISLVVLWVLEGNDGARRFYESVGFDLDHGHTKRVEREGAVLSEVRYRRTL